MGGTRSPRDGTRTFCPQGRRHFANPSEIQPAAEFALRKGQEKGYLRAHPGEVMGYLAFAHPFLDGNGRAIVTLISVLAQRADFSIDWSETDKDGSLDALTKEIEVPSKGHLDDYLKPFIRAPIAHEELAAQVMGTPGLDGPAAASDENQVVGEVDAPEVKAQYEAMLLKRGREMKPEANDRLPIHHSPNSGIGLAMCLAAIAIYLWSDDLSWVPGLRKKG